MVVQPEIQRAGVGRILVQFGEEIAKHRGFITIVLDSREESIGFYQKLGYVEVGERFFFKTVMHQKMEKRVGP